MKAVRDAMSPPGLAQKGSLVAANMGRSGGAGPHHICFGQEEWGKGQKEFQAVKGFPQKPRPITADTCRRPQPCRAVTTSVKKKAGNHCP